MSHLKKRIKRLEIQVLGDEDQLGFTWEELQQLSRFLDPESFKRRAEEPGGWYLRQLAETPFPRNIKQLVRRWERFQEEYRSRISDCPDPHARLPPTGYERQKPNPALPNQPPSAAPRRSAVAGPKNSGPFVG